MIFSLLALAGLWAGPTTIGPFDPSVRILGRFDSTSAGAVLSWPGTGAQIAFEGKSCQVRIGSTGAVVGVVVDGLAAADLKLVAPANDTLVSVAANLKPGRHVVELVKKTEPMVGVATLKGFVVDGKGSTLPQPATRRIEFVGNSITCGYGVLDSVKEHHFSAETEDFTATFAALSAKALGADLQVVAYSGKGLLRNYEGDNGPVVPALYSQSIYSETPKPWHFARWTPDVVVIDLGTNDFSRAPLPDSSAWESAWMAFLETIRKARGNVPVVLVNGPMLSDYWPNDANGKPLPSLTKVRRHLRNVAAQAKAKGFASVTVLDLAPNSPERGYGADWHPNRAQQALNGQELTAHLKKTLGW